MKLVEIAGGRVTMELYPEDCTYLLIACEIAADCADGTFMPSTETIARLRLSRTLEGMYHALGSAFEAARMAALLLNEVPDKMAAQITLTAQRADPVVWGNALMNTEGQHHARH